MATLRDRLRDHGWTLREDGKWYWTSDDRDVVMWRDAQVEEWAEFLERVVLNEPQRETTP